MYTYIYLSRIHGRCKTRVLMIESRPGTEISSRASGRHDSRCGQYGSGPKPTSTQQSLIMRTPVLSSTGSEPLTAVLS